MKNERFYRVKGIPGFEGLIVESDGDLQYETMLAVKNVVKPELIVGDRAVRFPIPPGAVLISHDFLEPTEEPPIEFSNENPFGECIYEGTYVKGNLNIAYTEFENALSVTVFEKHGDSQKTLYSQNFFTNGPVNQVPSVMEAIQSVLDGSLDSEDLIFELKRLKEEEAA